ncbi:MAG TPA: ferric reductase-like transmembrane domain-containing protein [Caulobacteraceae bacterium]|nr:ferric reductase-like transmembrane domain-containing protein [Caulobacteraceae bacterium]
MKPILDSRPLLWALLAAPAALIAWLYATDAYSYGQVVHVTGDTSVRLLIVTMAATPLRLMFPRAGWAMWLMRRRRDFGVATFGYAAFHLVVYLVRKAQPGLILSEGMEPELLTGWLAFLAFLPLAATSNDASVRWLKRGWKRLHRLVYLAAVLVFAHWLLEAFTLTQALIHAGVLAGLEATRLVLSRRRPSPANSR